MWLSKVATMEAFPSIPGDWFPRFSRCGGNGLGPACPTLGYGNLIGPFQGWRWISEHVPMASLRFALGYLIPARWALCGPGPLCSLWLNPEGAGSESRIIEMRD